jgi:DNA polymerase-3 subunit delta'
MTLPWLDSIWQRLNQARLRDRLPHALLLSGVTGIGKQIIARQLAEALLCEAPDAEGSQCGKCSACAWLQAGTHPDLLIQRPEEPGKSIKVDEIRGLCGNLAMTSHSGRYKIAIIEPAEALNINAANSLLKTLEEPTERTLLMLLSAAPGRLPATIRSRCQQVSFPLPDYVLAHQWLEGQGLDSETATHCMRMAMGAPLKALELANSGHEQLREQCLQQLQLIFEGSLDPLRVAADWGAEQQQAGLEGWRAWIEEAIRWKIAGYSSSERPDRIQLQQILEKVDCRVLFNLADRIGNALNNMGTGLNRQLILEDLLISWAEQSRQGSKRQMATGR